MTHPYTMTGAMARIFEQMHTVDNNEPKKRNPANKAFLYAPSSSTTVSGIPFFYPANKVLEIHNTYLPYNDKHSFSLSLSLRKINTER
jgi:hypothetical protein